MTDKVRDLTGGQRSVPEMLEALEALQSSQKTTHGGGGNGGDMAERIAKLEAGQEAIKRELDQRFDRIDASLSEIKAGLLSKWDMALVIFYIVAALSAAAIFGPRLAGLLPAS